MSLSIGMNKLSFFCLFVLVSSLGFSQQRPEARKYEQLISRGVGKAFSASVYIIEFDTLKNQVKNGVDEADGFTGVVVSAAGHILTVSHAAKPNEVYRVSFPDGTKRIAVGLGRIGLQDKGVDYDMAMLKILKPGKWPFAEMASSTEVYLNEPVISIAYPSSFFKATPNVRFGRVTDIDYSDGFITSSAKMEPGDSGGPLLDAFGRVIGIHSWIKEREDDNFDVPVDFFLQFWSALNVPKDYRTLPEKEPIRHDALKKPIQYFGSIDEVTEINPTQFNAVVLVTSKSGSNDLSVSGTLVNYHSGKRSFTGVLSKSSMVRKDPLLKSGNHFVKAEVISRDKDRDLVLLKPLTTFDGGIKIQSNAANPSLHQKDLGKILVSALPDQTKKTGVLSALYTDMPLKASIGYIGANIDFKDKKLIIAKFNRGSSAAQFLKVNDQLTKINGVIVNDPEGLNTELLKNMAGDSITVNVLREGKDVPIGMYLSEIPTVRHVSFEFPGKKSVRSDGFHQVLVHDAAIRADECGGPVYDINGAFYGINIARRSRTSSIIMPKGAIAQFLKDAFQNIKF